LSLEGAEFMYKQNLFPKNYQLVANAEGEKAILFGNPILKRNIISLPPTLKKNELLIIFNQSNEMISLALSQVDCSISQELKPNDMIAINLVDRGYYLRKKQ
jgi:ribosome biogenesis protein Nip4